MIRHSRMKNRRAPGVLTRIGSSPARRLYLPLLAALFAAFTAAAGSAGALESFGHHHNAVADSAAHHGHASDPACSADCGENHSTGAHSHGDQPDTCCGFACHVSMAEAPSPLISPPGRSEQVARHAHSIRLGGSDPFEHPPRTTAFPFA